jgi:UDP-GlcNAc:undecaprenyl-phosphate GlcNAc-1-phosphate transferase
MATTLARRMTAYLIVFALATVLSYLLTFPARRVAIRLDAVVAPTQRGVHLSPLPTVGSGSMFVAFLVAMGAASLLPQLHSIFQGSSNPIGVVLASTVIFAVGALDDFGKSRVRTRWKDLSSPAKAAGQVLAAMVLYFFGVTLFYFRIPFLGFMVLGWDLSPLFTALWVFLMTNAINFIDGLDGLAAGVVAIASAAFFVYSQWLGHLGLLAPGNVGPLCAIIACGVCIGFLPHNVHPARIMMGDSGALFLGLLMAASTMTVGGQTPPQFHYSGATYFFLAPVFIPFVIFGVPVFDAFFAALRRSARGTSPFDGDGKDHLHHRLMALGHGHRRSVVLLWTWTALLSGLVLVPVLTGRGNSVVPIGIVALAVGLYTMFHPQVRRTRSRRLASPGALPASEAAVSLTTPLEP